MHNLNHALQYSIYKHNNANSSSWLKTFRYKMGIKKKNMLLFFNDITHNNADFRKAAVRN